MPRFVHWLCLTKLVTEVRAIARTQQQETMPIRLTEERSLGLLHVLLTVAMFVTTCVAQDTLIQAGHIVDPGSDPVVQHQSILVRAGRIAAIGETLQAPAGAQVSDLSGAWVLPGLGDAHQHITLDFPPAPAKGSVWEGLRLNESTAERALRGIRNAGALLAAGHHAIRGAKSGTAPERGTGGTTNTSTVTSLRKFEWLFVGIFTMEPR